VQGMAQNLALAPGLLGLVCLQDWMKTDSVVCYVRKTAPVGLLC